ncbi:Aste57867_5008 [Aphanomyces stellatus]|uniref:Aste57867_5008 protein n=1 Tax=Aphanomyces stellatus TaxID=120398 RepID=A0A485KG85_9STRA|nr:hypothetical protein As57867_004995 [Aphanomyces stellatus]VFT82092.1 Aste57867_5008 [Aphanomyces stellatus]
MVEAGRTNYLAANGAVVVATLCLLNACALRHVRNPLQHMRPLQTLFLRLDLVFGLYLVLFYLRVVLAEQSRVMEPLAQFFFPVLEGLALFCFFNMMLLLVGGTAAAVSIMDQVQGGGVGDLQTDAWLNSPSKTTLDRYRRRLVLFLVLKPILGVVDGWAVNQQVLNPTVKKYHTIHTALGVVAVVMTVLAFVGVMRTYAALKKHIAPSFRLTAKFLTVKAMLLVSTLQWNIVNAAMSDWTPSDLYIYGSVCVGEAALIAVVFFYTFTAKEPDVPRLDTEAAPFHPCAVLDVADLFVYPLGQDLMFTAAV